MEILFNFGGDPVGGRVTNCTKNLWRDNISYFRSLGKISRRCSKQGLFVKSWTSSTCFRGNATSTFFTKLRIMRRPITDVRVLLLMLFDIPRAILHQHSWLLLLLEPVWVLSSKWQLPNTTQSNRLTESMMGRSTVRWWCTLRSDHKSPNLFRRASEPWGWPKMSCRAFTIAFPWFFGW